MLRRLLAAAAALAPAFALLAPSVAGAAPRTAKVRATVVAHPGVVDDGPARGGEKHAAKKAAAKKAPPSESVGTPSAGHLEHGARFEDAAAARFAPVYAGSDVRYGTDELVALVHEAAKKVAAAYPGSVLNVGQLSRPGGGDVDRHASHESGRDVDLPFYVTDKKGKPHLAAGFVAFRADGTSADHPGLHFDVARNWALVSALVNSKAASVSHIFVADPQRRAILGYAKAHGADPATIARAASVLAAPKGVLPHDDHFHVRIACPAGDGRCVENPAPSRATAKKTKGKAGGKKVVKATKGPHGAGGKGLTKVATAAKTTRPAEPEETEAEGAAEDPLERLLSPQVEGLGSIQLGRKR